MGEYNPHKPSILGQEWAPVKEMPYLLDTETERGVTFVLDHVATVVSGAVYIADVPPSVSSKSVMMAVYEAGTEHLTGPIQRVVVPPVSGFWRSTDSLNPADIDVDPSNTPIHQVLLNPNDNSFVTITEDVQFYVMFDTSTVASQLSGKRILEVNFLYVMSGTQSGVPGPVPDNPVTHGLWLHRGNPDSLDQLLHNSDSDPTVSLTLSTVPEINRSRNGNTMYWDMTSQCVATPAGPGALLWPVRPTDLSRFDLGTAAGQRLSAEFTQSDGCSGCASVNLPRNSYSYAALEILYCEETRLLYGGRGQYACDPHTLVVGQNKIMLKPTDTFAVTGKVLQPGEYTVTVTMADMGEEENSTGGNYSATALLQKYPLPTHTGVVVDTRVAEGRTFVRSTSDILPRVTLHTASSVVTGVHTYDTLTPGTVYNGVAVAPDVMQRSNGAAEQYPQVRFYARRFGNTNVPLTLRRQSAPSIAVSISVDDFDALPEITDGWREVTLRFADALVPTFGNSGGPLTWEWVANGLAINDQWEILVPMGASSTVAPFDTSDATYGGSLGFTAVGSSFFSLDADATLIFSQDPPPVSGFAISVAEQTLRPIGQECDVDPRCVPTALYYHDLTWDARDALDLFEDRETTSGWDEAPSGQLWTSSGGSADDFFVVSGAGHMRVDTVNTLYFSTLEASAYNSDVHGVVRIPVVPTGAAVTARVLGRLEDTNNYYEAQLSISTGGVPTLILTKRVGGTGAVISPSVTIDGTHEAGDSWHIVLRSQGDNILGQAWKDGYPRPLNWQAVGNIIIADSVTGTGAGLAFRTESGFLGGTVDVEWLEFSATSLDITAFELQRRDEVDDEWQTIMLSTGTALSGFRDYEARVGVESEYRIRTVNELDFYGPWSTTLTSTLTSPGVAGLSDDGNSVLIFTTNERQGGLTNLAYVMTWESDVTEEFSFPEASTVQLRDVFRRDFPIAFRPAERGGERFSRDIIVQNAAVPTGLERDGFRSLRDLAWEDVSYICVRNELGDRWFANVNVPSGQVTRNRRLYIARIDIAEVSAVPSAADPATQEA